MKPGECPKCYGANIDYVSPSNAVTPGTSGMGYYMKGHYCYDAKCLDCGTTFVEKYNIVFEDAVITE